MPSEFFLVENTSAANHSLYHQLDTPEQRSAHFHRITDMMRTFLGSMGINSVRSADEHPPIEDARHSIIDNCQPTIGLRYDLLETGVLLGAAVNRMRAMGEAAPNILVLPSSTYSHEGTPQGHRSGYFTYNGAVVTQRDTVIAGDFKSPLRIDALSDKCSMAPDDESVQSINDLAADALLNDKSAIEQSLAKSGWSSDRVCISGVSAYDDRLYALIATSYEAGTSLVIKPVNGERGEGVIMLNPARISLSEVHRQLRQYAKPQKLVAERWVQSRELIHSTTKIRQDWNLRVLIVGQKIVGSFARVGVLGSPINLATGAIAQNTEEVFAQARIKGKDRVLVLDRIYDLSDRVTRLSGANIVGEDIIVTDELDVELIETNGRRSGGLGSIMLVNKLGEIDWEPAFRAVRLLSDSLFGEKEIIKYPLPVAGQLMYRKVTPESLINDALSSDNESSETLDTIQSASLTVEPHIAARVSEYIAKRLSLRDYMDESTVCGYQQNPAMGLEAFEYFYDRGNTEMAYRFLSIFAAVAPDTLTHQQRATDVFMLKLAKDEQTLQDFFIFSTADTYQAEAYARATYDIAMGLCKLDFTAVSAGARRDIIANLQDMYMKDSVNTADLVNGAAISGPEATYLMPMIRFIQRARSGSVEGRTTVHTATYTNNHR